MSFSSATAISGGPGTWTATLEEGWDIFGVTNGGYLMSIATRAMEAEADGRELISATASFMNPATPGPVEVAVEALKRGRSLSTLRATLSRQDRDLVYVTGVYADPGRPINDATLTRGAPPSMPAPEDCISTEPASDAPIPTPFTGKVELRVPSEDVGVFGTAAEARSRGWFRLRDGEGLNAHAVVLATDSFPPAIFFSNLAVGWTPTVDMTIQIRNPAPVGWLACQYTTRYVSGGMLEEDGEIWDENGLVAISRQLALVPR